jgi:hypothetical protein
MQGLCDGQDNRGCMWAVNPQSTEKTWRTHNAQIMGTPQYMTLKQAETSRLGVNTMLPKPGRWILPATDTLGLLLWRPWRQAA